MLKQHKNTFLQRIEQCGLGTTRFHGFEKHVRNKILFTIELRNSPLQFQLEQAGNSFDAFKLSYTRFAPAYPMTATENPIPLETALRVFDEWLKFTIRRYTEEQQTPDLWAQLETYAPLIDTTAISEEDSREFTEEEKELVRNGTQEFRQLIIANFTPTEEQAEVINNRLDYLEKAIDRLNRIDWKALAISTVIAIGINLYVDTEKGRLLFALFQQALGAALKLLPPGIL